jgi:hypothetical protein
VRPFELDMLRALGAAFLATVAERKEEADRPPPVVSERPLTPALFKAVVMGQR